MNARRASAKICLKHAGKLAKRGGDRAASRYDGDMIKGSLLFGLVLVFLALSGCAKPLFPENAYRTPYDRYMALRGERRRMTEPTTFGREVPAIRERLKPLGQP